MSTIKRFTEHCIASFQSSCNEANLGNDSRLVSRRDVLIGNVDCRLKPNEGHVYKILAVEAPKKHQVICTLRKFRQAGAH